MICSSASFSVRPRVMSLLSWLTGDLADGRLVDEAGIDGVSRDLRTRADDTVVHDDGVALRVHGALVVAADVGVEHLGGVILGDRARDDVRARLIAVKVDGEVRPPRADDRGS